MLLLRQVAARSPQIDRGPTVFICDECVELCNDIIREETKGALNGRKEGDVPTPQESAKFWTTMFWSAAGKACLVGCCPQPLQRLNHGGKGADVELAKSNILLVGPTVAARRCWLKRLLNL